MKYIVLVALLISVANAQTYHCVPIDPEYDPNNCSGDDYFTHTSKV